MLIVRKILYIINLVLAIALILTYTSAFFPQDVFTKISLLGYLYPPLLIANIVLVLLWLVLKPRHALLSVIAIGIRYNYITRLVNYSPSQEDGELKILTYNVHDFIHGKDTEQYLGQAGLEDSILNYISSKQADVVCLQDYDVNIKWKNGFHQQMIDSLLYSHFYYYNSKSQNISNVAIYSKLPIVDVGSAMEDSDASSLLIYTDIKTEHQIVRIYNLHLRSYMLGEKEKSDYKAIMKGKVSDSASENIIKKLLDANQYRAKQVRYLVPEIEKQQKAVIICGDFNDHPFSNTYRKFAKNFSDSFISKGNGIGGTYNGVFPGYRIDYIWYDKNRLECTSYSSEQIDFSDHFPVFSTFKIKRQ